jgi:hypothetical protein
MPELPNLPHPRQTETAELLRRQGLDLCHWFSVGEVNAKCAEEFSLPTVGQWGLLIGNSRALWTPFLRRKQSLSQKNSQSLTADPLDTYVEQMTRRALSSWDIRWLAFGHSAGTPLPIQKYAAASGLAPLGPAGLCIHPTFGPWIALRAVAILESDYPLKVSETTDRHPCAGCPAPCTTALKSALRSTDDSLRRFLPVRDACPVGTHERYTDPQIDFHYNRRAR